MARAGWRFTADSSVYRIRYLLLSFCPATLNTVVDFISASELADIWLTLPLVLNRTRLFGCRTKSHSINRSTSLFWATLNKPSSQIRRNGMAGDAMTSSVVRISE